MQPMHTAFTTAIYGSITDGGIQLPVAKEYGNGISVCTSFWRTTLRERMLILFGKPIAVTLHCEHPPATVLYVSRIKRKYYSTGNGSI